MKNKVKKIIYTRKNCIKKMKTLIDEKGDDDFRRCYKQVLNVFDKVLSYYDDVKSDKQLLADKEHNFILFIKESLIPFLDGMQGMEHNSIFKRKTYAITNIEDYQEIVKKTKLIVKEMYRKEK